MKEVGIELEEGGSEMERGKARNSPWGSGCQCNGVGGARTRSWVSSSRRVDGTAEVTSWCFVVSDGRAADAILCLNRSHVNVVECHVP